MRICVMLSLVFCFCRSDAQKPLIDSNAYNKWPFVQGGNISNDGKYVHYIIHNGELFSINHFLSYIKSVSGTWTFPLPRGVRYASFTDDSKYAIFKTATDTLYIVKLGSNQVEKIPNVKFFLLSEGRKNYLSYLVNDDENSLVIRKVNTRFKREFLGISQYWFADNDEAIVLQGKEPASGESILKWTSLTQSDEKIIWKGTIASNIVIDKSGTQLAFTVQNGTNDNCIFFYRKGDDSAKRLEVDSTIGMIDNFQFANLSEFSDDRSKLFVKLKKFQQHESANADAVDVNVWHYNDFKLQSQQLKELEYTPTYTSVIDLDSKRCIQLQKTDNEYVGDYQGGDYCAVAVNNTSNLQIKPRRIFYLVSLGDGSRKAFDHVFRFSPDEKFIVYFDPKQKGFFSYQAATGVQKCITKGLRANWLAFYGAVEDSTQARGIAAWIEGEPSVLVYDRYDIWKLDLMGQKPAQNLTNGYGAKNKIVFYLSQRLYADKRINRHENLLLTAFDLNNKDNGFFRKKISSAGDPVLLTMGPYIYEVTNNPYVERGFAPIKAKEGDNYLIQRMSATESPNLFVTKDFKTFHPITNVHPEKQYNWYVTELHTWKSLDGRLLQGILYKPEDFDPGKKYPVIFNFYERYSDGLNEFINPKQLSHGCSIDIPSYVSKGYLVFRPDIYYTIGDPMQGAKDAVISAINYVSKLSFVDSTRLGAQGCSFGAIETNYLITQTNRFKAAVSASGIVDWIGQYGSLAGDGSSFQSLDEMGQNRMGGSIWEIPDKYLKNSPILYLDRVTTPVLIMHTTADNVCPFSQAIEMFTGLRRLGKKVWMLQYNDGNHGVLGKSGTDFSIRMQQFFDHYLKGKPAPVWMTRGIPAKMKGIDTGLELDTSVHIPPGVGGVDKRIQKADAVKITNCNCHNH